MEKKINFIGNSKKFFTISAILVALVLIGTIVRGVSLDIQFKGGAIVTYSYDGDIDLVAVDQVTDDLLNARIFVQKSETLGSGYETTQTIIVSLPGEQGLTTDELQMITDGLREAFPENNIEALEINNIDPTMGHEFLAKCITAVVVASVLMMIYVAFRFRKIGGLSAGAMAVVALVHDVILTFGVFVLFGIPINDNFIAVVLTILGYSLNDTIVIYDRIRENDRLVGSKMPLAGLVDLSINQSFKRSLMTSITTVMAMTIVTVVALVFNVSTIISFSFPLIIGLASGSYSSLCLAGPLWVKWQEKKQGPPTASATVSAEA